MIYRKNDLLNGLFFDIEAISQKKSLSELPEPIADIWKRKYHFKCLEKEEKFLAEQFELGYISVDEASTPTMDEIYVKYAPLYAEFGKVICISYGLFDDSTGVLTMDIESLSSDKEFDILQNFAKILTKAANLNLAGYNIVGFDIPYLIKRMLIHKIALPPALSLRGKKPWEINVMDIMKDYQSTSYEPVTLDLLCHTFGLPTPKDLIQNYQVSTKYHNGSVTVKDIVDYCEKDLKAEMTVALYMSI